jgi:hypothetical protein
MSGLTGDSSPTVKLPGTTGGEASPPTAGGDGAAPAKSKSVEIRFSATRADMFKAFPALANLADKADDGKITVRVSGTSASGFGPGLVP